MGRPKKQDATSAKRVRSRPNAIIVNMDDATRAMLDAVVEDERGKTPHAVTMTSVVVGWIHREFKARKLRPPRG